MNSGNFPRQYRWLIALAIGVSLICAGWTPREPLGVQKTSSQKDVEAKEIDTMQAALYSVDLIETDTVVLVSRSRPDEMITVPYQAVEFAQEGDILRATGDPSRPYELDQEATLKVRENTASLLRKLTSEN
ncbi:MAG: DUF3006 domain-containing protein [Firmicutes bacterium]|jgi:hypothetical protein|nr:DUF3006 domain-containing protein [Bacillota bacterium]